MAEKVAIFLLAGPDMPCRMVHTFIWAVDIVGRGGEAKIVLEGEAPRWLLELPNPEHGRNGLYRKVKQQGLIDAVCADADIRKPVPSRPARSRRPPRRASGWSTMPPVTSAWSPTLRPDTTA